jgi:tRNA A-37 threonylcarbamoyl transferase component Bud32
MTDRPDLAEQFWALWRQGQAPDVRAFLANAGEVGPAALVAVLRIDQQQRWQRGEEARAEDYLAAFPALESEPEKAVELIYCEFLLREGRGATVALASFLARFPTHADRLRQQIELHWALGESSAVPVLPPEKNLLLLAEDSSQGTLTPPTVVGDPSSPGVMPSTELPAFPGYELLRELGRGGMGVVYQARDLKRQRAVALKVMQWVGPDELYRFKQEFRSLADLNHPNLVSLYVLHHDPQWFFTMELVEGAPFLTHVRGAPRGGPLASVQIERLRAALVQLAEGVLALHSAGKLHRDIKPGNVLVDRDGRVVVLDFGLAAELDRQGQYLSAHPRLLGTVAYMAPEQAACKAVSPASDWYAVGVMLFEALTGRPPFEGTPMMIMLDKQNIEPPSPADIVPGAPPDLADLCVALLRRNPADRPSGEEVLRRLRAHVGSAPAARPAPGLEVPLVGRERHRAALHDAFAAVKSGRAVVQAVHGRSGAGKSALLRSFLDELAEQEGAVVLAGRCYEQESVPYKALDSLIDALSRYLEGLPALQAVALLPRDILALARVFPRLRRLEVVASYPRRGGDVSDPQELRRRAVASLRELLGRLGDRQPLVLAIDDLQWGDMDSAAILAELLAPPDPPVLLLIGCYRSEDVGTSPCLAAFARLAALVEERELAVEPLGPEERRALVLALLGPEAGEVADAIARQSGGYPFFVHELVRYLQSGSTLAGGTAGDFTLGEVLWARVGQLPQPARALLEVVAVAGRPVRLDSACRAAEVAEERPALALLRSGRLLRAAGAAERNEVETYHDRVRETVVAHLEAAVRQRHHRRLAEVLEEGPACDPELLAVHWQGAGERVKAGEHYARAAEQAAEALAFDRAAKLFRLSLELRPVQGAQEQIVRARLGDALAGGGRGAEAAREYQSAAELAERTGDAGAAVELQRRAALQYLSSGRVDAGLAALGAVLGAVGLRLCATPRRAFWSLVWQRLRLRLRGLGYRKRAASEVPAEELKALDICLSAAVGLGMVDPIQGAYFQSRGLLLALRAGEPERLVKALALEACHESIAGNRGRRRTDKLLWAAAELAHEVNLPYPRAMVSLARGVAAALEGDWARGRLLCDEAEGIFRELCTGVMWELGTAHRFALWPLMFMGEVAEIRRRLPGLMKEAQERDDLYGMSNLSLVIRTFVRLAGDEPQRARAELGEVMDLWSQQGYQVQHMNRLYDEAIIDLYQGDGASAWRRVAEQWPLVQRSHLLRVQQVRIFLFHMRGRCALAIGGPAEAQREARALWREKAAWASALAQLLEAGVAAQRGDAKGAQGALGDAVKRCEATGMRLFAAAARRRLGELVGGDEGRLLIEQADEWMRGQQVVSPERTTALLVPGLGERGDR